MLKGKKRYFLKHILQKQINLKRTETELRNIDVKYLKSLHDKHRNENIKESGS